MTDPPATALVPARLALQARALEGPQNPALVYLAHLGPGSRRAMRDALDRVARILTGQERAHAVCPWHLIAIQEAGVLRTHLVSLRHGAPPKPYGRRTLNRFLAALRGVLEHCWRRTPPLMDADHLQRLRRELRDFAVRDLPKAGRMLEPGEYDALREQLSRRSAAETARNAAILACLRVGLRCSEVTGLDVAHYLDRFADGVGKLDVLGKGRDGGKWRVVPLAGDERDAMRAWVACLGGATGPVFRRVGQKGKIGARRLGSNAVRTMVVRAAKEAGMPHTTPHDFRRTFISTALDQNIDVKTVAKLVGHSSTDTTTGYDRRDERAGIEAMRRVRLP